MSYDVGSYYDLTHINTKAKPKPVVVPTRQKKSLKKAVRKLHVVGTSYVFQATPAGLKAAIQVPVVFA